MLKLPPRQTDRKGVTDDLATSCLNYSLYSETLCRGASKPCSALFRDIILCLPCLILSAYTLPYRIVLANLVDREMCPYYFSLCLFLPPVILRRKQNKNDLEQEKLEILAKLKCLLVLQPVIRTFAYSDRKQDWSDRKTVLYQFLKWRGPSCLANQHPKYWNRCIYLLHLVYIDTIGASIYCTQFILSQGHNVKCPMEIEKKTHTDTPIHTYTHKSIVEKKICRL